MPWYPLNNMDGRTNGLEEKGLYSKPPYKPIFDSTTLKAEQPMPTDPGFIQIEIRAYPRPEVDWYWQRIKIKRKTDTCEAILTELGNDHYLCELKVHAFSIYDVGDYKIVASNRIGKSVYSFNLNADEERNNPRILEGPISRYLGDHKYRLELTAWCPQFEGCVWEKWRKNERKGTQKDYPLDFTAKCHNSDDYRIKRDAVERDGAEGIYDIYFEIAEATINDRGTYRCIIYDKTDVISCIFTLVLETGDIIGRPELYTEPKIFQMKTENIIMAFCIRSTDPLKYSWVLPDGKTVQQEQLDGRENMTFTQRKIKSPTGEDHLHEGRLNLDHCHAKKGCYTCLAENKYGILQIKFELKVSAKMMDSKSRWYEKLYG